MSDLGLFMKKIQDSFTSDKTIQKLIIKKN